MTVRTETIEYQGYRIIAVEWLGQWQASVIPTSLNLPRPAGEQQCLGGTRTSAADKVFIGWFGPRWLATIVFAILVLDAPGNDTVMLAAGATVLLSVIAHGVTANALVKAIGGRREETPSSS